MNEEQTEIERLSLVIVFTIAAIIAAVGIAILNEIDHEQDAAIAACRVPARRTR